MIQRAKEAGVGSVWAAGFASHHILVDFRIVGNKSNPVLFFFFQVDSITSMVRGAVVARAFEQTKCFTPGRGLQGKSPGL